MQLIVDTDTDISVPTKMSTIQQESLSETFNNTSLIPNLCNDITDITNGNDKCVINQEIAVKECEENVKATDQNAQHTETCQETIVNDKCEEIRLCDKESAENKEYGQTENIQNVQIEDKYAVQDEGNYEIAVDVPIEEKNVLEVNNKEYKNNSNIHNRTKQESTGDCGLFKKELNNRVMKDEVETEKQVNKVEAQNDMLIENIIEDPSNSDIENNRKDLREVTNETGDKIEKQNDKNIEMDIANEEHVKVDSSKISDKVLEPVEVNHEIEHRSEKQNEEHIEMDVEIGEHTDVTSSVKEDIKVDNATKVLIVDQVKATNTKEELRQRSEENNEMDVTIKKQDKSNSSVIADKIKTYVEVTHGIEDKCEKQNVENMELDVIIEKQDESDGSVAQKGAEQVEVAHKIEDATKVLIVDQVKATNTKEELRQRIEENNEMDVTIEEQDNSNSDKIETFVEVTHGIEEDKCEKQTVENMELDVLIEKQDESDGSVAQMGAEEVKVAHKIEDKCEKQNQEIDMDATNEERDKVTGNDNINEEVKLNIATEDQVKVTKEKEDDMDEMDVTFEEQDKVSVTEDNIGKGNGENSEIKVQVEQQDQVNPSVTKDKIEAKYKVEQHTYNVSVLEKGKDELDEPGYLNKSAIEDQLEKQSKDNNETKVKRVQLFNENNEIQDKLEQQNEISAIINKLEEEEKEESQVTDNFIKQVKNKSESEDKQNTQIRVTKDISAILDDGGTDNCKTSPCMESEKEIDENRLDSVKAITNENNEIQDKLEQQNEISTIINKLEEEEKEESQVTDNFIKQVKNKSESEDKQNTQIRVTKDISAILDDGGTDNCKTSPCMESEKEIDENRLDSVKAITSLGLAQRIHQSRVVSQEVEKHKNESERKPEDVENKTKVVDENTIQNLEMQVSKEKKSSNTIENNTESAVTQMDTTIDDEVIDIADEKDDEYKKEPKNTVKMDTSVEKAETALKNDVQESKTNVSDEVDLASHTKLDPEASVKEANLEHANLIKTVTEIVGEKKKLTHISKLSNTLDILSDEDEDLPKEVPLKEIPATDKELTSINIDDDDDIMLIDEEPSPKDNNNKTESTPEPINEVIVKEYSTVEPNEKKNDPLSEISESNKDTIEAEVAMPSITETKVSKPKSDLIAQEEPSTPKKPLLKPNFLKTCKKNLADMTRNELEEFCILKIVESVVDRSNLSEIKSQFKALAQNIEEYKKKASVLTKQNRDLQVVLKSVQEEQKKKSNMPITPLKITRSVGMQVLMTDKVGARKKTQNPNTAKSNAGAKSGPKQGKTAPNNARLQKVNTSNNSPIPVPRLVPAINSSNLNNNMKLQPSPANAPVKSQITGTVNKSPVQSLSNGLPAASPVQKPEKRPHSRMQQNESVTVDLTDDEPPAKVLLRNVTPPVRLVPPQNLLAPNRQPFGQNVSSPRKVYIPISGSQTPVGVRPGQTIMLRTISPQGPRQRAPTPGLAKPNQSSNTVRIQRVPSRHPAPLPESVKQYQPQNWKALPPAPELKLAKVDNGIVISWKIDGYQEENHEEIASYQLYAYQETTSPPDTTLWKKIGDVKALALPMACTLTQFMAGYKYYFAVRAVDIRSRVGPFSLPGSILLLNKM